MKIWILQPVFVHPHPNLFNKLFTIQSHRVVSHSVFYIITVTSYLMRFRVLQKKK